MTMQYILTQAELDALHESNDERIRTMTVELQEVCTMAADHVPVTVNWFNDGKPKPWGCILTVKHEHYCDECPVNERCPFEHKHWSK